MPGHGSAVTAPAYIGICPDKLLHRWATAWDAIQINGLLLQLRIVTPVANVGSPLVTLHLPHGFLPYIGGWGVFLVFPMVDCI